MDIRARWYDPVRAIHDEHFYDPWEERLRRLNARLALHEDDVFLTHGPGLPPPWFNGDIEVVQQHRWVLVISLNPRLNPRDPDAQDWYRDQRFTPAAYWEHWRRFNTRHWYPPFFSPLVKLAAGALGIAVEPADIPSFATNQMLFVELCPYGSQKFSLSRHTVEELVRSEPGVRIAAEVRRILIEKGQPSLILVNGTEALNDFESVESERIELGEVRYESVDAPAMGKKRKCLWHKQGHYHAQGRRIPLVGFPFLRSPRTHNSNAERRQLETLIREFLGGLEDI